MDVTYHHTITSSGLSLDVLLSGMQKAARQGHVSEILWACGQAFDFILVEQGKKTCTGPDDEKKFKTRVKSIVTNILHRFMVIYLEDVHAGEPQLWSIIDKKMKEIFNSREDPSKNGKSLENLKLVAVLLAIARHSRVYSHVRRAIQNKLDCELPKVVAGIVKYIDLEKFTPTPLSGIDTKWWKREIPPRERWIVGAASAIHADLLALESVNRSDELLSKAAGLIDKTIIPDTVPGFFSSRIVVDQHTKKGSSNEDNFTFLGSTVVNERFLLPPIFHAYYTSSKAYDAPSKDYVPDIDVLLEKSAEARKILTEGFRESDLLKLELRAQITCATTRPDTYFARLWGFPVFVKGPFLSKQAKDVTSQIWIHENLKTKLPGMVSVKPWVCKLIPDQWESVPLGARNTFTVEEKKKPQLFIVWKSIFPHSAWPIPSRIVESKLWPKTAVVDFTALTKHAAVPDVTAMKPKSLTNWVVACMWRYVAAIPDNAERNFLLEVSSGNIYSLDEDAPFRETGPSPFKYKKEKNDAVIKHISSHSDEILSLVSKWASVFEAAGKLKDCPYDFKSSMARLASIQTVDGLKAVFYYEWKSGKKSDKSTNYDKDVKKRKPSDPKDKNVKKQKTILSYGKQEQ